jgi:hypothetical protein
MTEADALLFVVDDDESVRQSLKNLIGSVGLRGGISFPPLVRCSMLFFKDWLS